MTVLFARLAPVLVVVTLAGCDRSTATSPSPVTSIPSSSSGPLRTAGSAVNKLVGAAVQAGLLSDASYRTVLDREFSAITTENDLKWANVEPVPGGFDFASADAIVGHASAFGMQVKGHTLLWHQQIPGWLDGLSPDALRQAVTDHIQGVVGHYRGRVRAWDVVNEALNDDGSWRDTVFWRGLGDSYVADAFRVAHAADPGALLFYNDYGAEGLGGKADRVYALVRDLKAAGVPIDGVGLQMHISAAGRPSDASIGANMRRLADLGLLVTISEMDVQLAGVGGTQAERLDAQRAAYHSVVALCVAEPRCDGVTFWGFTDAHTWLAPDLPLLFDVQYQPKPAYSGVLDALSGR